MLIWIKRINRIDRFNLVLKSKLTWFDSLMRTLLLMEILVGHIHIVHLMMRHLDWYHHWSPFSYRLLDIIIMCMMRIDILFHSVAVVMIHHNWHRLNLHDWRAFFACFSHGYGLLSICLNTVWHLVVIYIAELVLLRRNIRFNTSCICAI